MKKHLASRGSVFHLAAYGQPASCLRCYINETNPRSVRNDVDTEGDGHTSPSGVGPYIRHLAEAGARRTWRRCVFKGSANDREVNLDVEEHFLQLKFSKKKRKKEAFFDDKATVNSCV